MFLLYKVQRLFYCRTNCCSQEPRLNWVHSSYQPTSTLSRCLAFRLVLWYIFSNLDPGSLTLIIIFLDNGHSCNLNKVSNTNPEYLRFGCHWDFRRLVAELVLLLGPFIIVLAHSYSSSCIAVSWVFKQELNYCYSFNLL